jgi:phosphoadenosine phosphosulfate reductase
MKKNEQLINELNERFSGSSPQDVLAFFINEFQDKLAFATSLGAEDQVLTEMIAGIDRTTKIFTLDTGRMFAESYELIERTNARFKINIQVNFPERERVEKMVNDKGINLFYESVESRKLCCHIRKIEPLKRALQGLEVWISGLRRSQSVTRTDLKLVEWDESNNLVKLNPLIDWSEEHVWEYIRQKNIPYNPMHDQGFPSIGCQPCTRAVEPGEDVRAGRWWWEHPNHKECGLHIKSHSNIG